MMKLAERAEKYRKEWAALRARLPIVLTDTTATMPRMVLNVLDEYSTSRPSGVYAGKIWKRRIPTAETREAEDAALRLGQPQRWLLGEYVDDGDQETMKIVWREIVVAP